MLEFVLPSLIAALALLAGFTGLVHWVRYVIRRRKANYRAQGYRLIHALKEYSAWIDCQRDDLPFTAMSLDELTSPEPMTLARQLKRDWFPELHTHIVLLLQAHNRMIEHLWRQSLLRLSQGSAWVPAHRDRTYQQLRGAQEELIEEMIDVCRDLIGDSRREWKRTGSDFAFSNSFGMSSQGPAKGA